MERWLPVRDFEGLYEISDLGRVRRVATGRILKMCVGTKTGHLKVILHDGDHVAQVKVHRLVLESFVGVRPAGLQCRHLDGNPTNNVVSNLAWGTVRENRADMIGHGTRCSTLTAVQVAEIRRRYPAQRLRALAAEFNVSHGAIHAIVTGATWRHLPLGEVHGRPARVEPPDVSTEASPRPW